jgi:polysaccharide export outer membrane protein
MVKSFTLRGMFATSFALALLSSLSCAQISAQESKVETPASPSATSSSAPNDYRIGPEDVLAISVTDAPEFSGRFRVNQSGNLVMTSLPAPLKAAGLTPMELSTELRKALEDAKLYRDPTVNVFVEEYRSQSVTVVGAVTKPGQYPLQKRTTVIQAVSEAGLLPTTGNRITLISAKAGSASDPNSTQTTQTFELGKLMTGKDPSVNAEVHDGDVISVATADVVYVVGAVTKPGGFVQQDRGSGVSALQAIALAEGMTSLASEHNGLIIRRNPDGTPRENVPVDLRKIMTGKQPDVTLQANDILFVPVSGSKQTLHTMGQIAMTAVNGVAFYGVGYRAGGY